jgi:hypothetical protein
MTRSVRVLIFRNTFESFKRKVRSFKERILLALLKQSRDLKLCNVRHVPVLNRSYSTIDARIQ